jgi:hypothetical protein
LVMQVYNSFNIDLGLSLELHGVNYMSQTMIKNKI